MERILLFLKQFQNFSHWLKDFDLDETDPVAALGLLITSLEQLVERHWQGWTNLPFSDLCETIPAAALDLIDKLIEYGENSSIFEIFSILSLEWLVEILWQGWTNLSFYDLDETILKPASN